MSHVHGPEDGRATCRFTTKKACEEAFADWQATQQVILAYGVALRGDAPRHRKEASLFSQLVLYIAGEKESLDNKDGTPSGAAFTKRVIRAIERLKAGEDIGGYNLYTPASADEKQEA